MTKVGFIGAGQMGMPMVRRLHGAGINISVHARRAEVIDELRALGIAVVADPSELAARVDVVEVCLFSDAQLREVLLTGGVAASMRPGTILLSHVTGSPALYDELSAIVATGVVVIDAPVSGTSAQIAVGDLTVLLGGDAGSVARVTPLLAAFASHVIHVGERGDAQRVKLINNLLFAANVRIAGEAIRVGEAIGIDQQRLVRALGQCSGRTWALGLLEDRPFAAFEAGTRRYLDKDFGVVEQVAAELGIDLGLLGKLAAS